jgi:hypothetical protein
VVLGLAITFRLPAVAVPRRRRDDDEAGDGDGAHEGDAALAEEPVGAVDPTDHGTAVLDDDRRPVATG